MAGSIAWYGEASGHFRGDEPARDRPRRAHFRPDRRIRHAGRDLSDDTIAALYGIENGTFNTLLGSVELAAPRGRIRCFAVGGCGFGIPFYRALQKRGIPFAAGILPANDPDMAAAAPLAQKVVTSAAYMPISEREIAEAREIIGRADFVIDCGCPAGEYNRANADLIIHAREEGKRVCTSLRELPEA